MPEPLVQFRDVTVVRNGRTALADVNLRIDVGECVAILGPNGSGKSSLVKSIAGDLHAYAGRGEVTIRGLSRWNLFELRSILGIVSNELQADCKGTTKGIDLVLSGFFGSYGRFDPDRVSSEMRRQAENCLARVEASYLRERSFEEMSSGEARRIMIARALVHRPEALLLDEPTTSLDIRAAHEFLESIRSLAHEGIGIILVTHHLTDIVPEIQRVVLLKQGRIFADGSRSDVLTEEKISALFEMPIWLHGDEVVSAGVVHTKGQCA